VLAELVRRRGRGIVAAAARWVQLPGSMAKVLAMWWKMLFAVALAYALLLLWMYSQQSRYVYLADFPGRTLFATPADVGLPFEQVWLQADDGTPLHGWYLPAASAGAATVGRAELSVLFLHGNAGNISHRLDTLQILHELGVNALIFDYRGYGISEGSPDEAGTYSDARAAWEWLRARGAPAARIVVHGRSLGGGVAGGLLEALAADGETPGGLVLESTFTSLADLGQYHYRWLPVRWLTRIIYPTRERLAALRLPLLVVHSPDDSLVPVAHGRALLAAARPSALGAPRWLEIGGAHHNGYLLSRERYAAGLGAFFSDVAALAGEAERAARRGSLQAAGGALSGGAAKR